MTKRATDKSPSEIGDLLCSKGIVRASKSKWGDDRLFCEHGRWTSKGPEWCHPGYDAQHQQKQINNALLKAQCVAGGCDRDFAPTSIRYCQTHLDYQNEWNRSQAEQSLKQGICKVAGCNKGLDSTNHCLIHKIKSNQRSNERYARKADARDTELMKQLADGREHGRVVATIRRRKVNMREKG